MTIDHRPPTMVNRQSSIVNGQWSMVNGQWSMVKKLLNMLLKFLISMLFIGLFTLTYGQESLIGNWRRVNPNIKDQDLTSKELKWGDLQINADSTFHIEGNSSTANSTISGWHSGNEDNGTWELRGNNRLFLWLEPKEEKIYLPFIIIKLTKDKLVLRLTLLMDDETKDITYLRI